MPPTPLFDPFVSVYYIAPCLYICASQNEAAPRQGFKVS